MDKQAILTEFEKTFSSLENTITLFNNEDFNTIPFEESWTPAQVVQHILLSIENFPSVLTGKTEETNRPIDKFIPTLKDIFLNFQTKMKSPDFIKPTLKDYDLDEQLTKIQHVSAEIKRAIEKEDLSRTCLGFQFPSLGLITGLESVYFIIFHTQRHTHQLTEIHRFLKHN
ncbi:DinB family protein [Pedobacter sp. Du54]|uniref:DinB family protein n=1 Tax=Pedobacter anseongensis TaxID=3133439 RepID=UPI0030B6B0AF